MAFQGSLRELPLPDIIQLVSVSGKTGMFSLDRESYPTGEIFLREGRIVHSRVGELEGEEAIYELAVWPEGDFVFTPGRQASLETVNKSNTNLLMEAARRVDEWQVLSKKIPSTRMVPAFTADATTTSVSLKPEEWQLVSKVDERRSIDEIAVGMGKSAFEVSKLLYGLLTSGLLTLRENLSPLAAGALESKSASELAALSGEIHRDARTLLAGAADRSRVDSVQLDTIEKLSRAEHEAGRGVDAVLDLLRADEKLISTALGAEQAQTFLARARQRIERNAI